MDDEGGSTGKEDAGRVQIQQVRRLQIMRDGLLMWIVGHSCG